MLMPLLFFILLIILIAQVRIWNTLGAILGAAAMMVLLVAIVVIGGFMGGWPNGPEPVLIATAGPSGENHDDRCGDQDRRPSDACPS